MIKAVIGIAIILALIFVGSTDAAKDEVVVRFAIVAIIIFLFPSIYVWKLIGMPAKLHREQLDEIGHLKEGKPCPIIHVADDDAGGYIDIENAGADAEFTVKILVSENRTNFPVFPVHGQWRDMSQDKSRFIQAGAFDGIQLFQTEVTTSPFLKTLHFLYVQGEASLFKKSTTWVPIKNHESIPPSGEILIYASSKPVMQGGSRTVKLGFEGDRLWVIEGEVESHL